MTKFNLNLGRGYVFSYRSRQLIQKSFIVYILIFGILLFLMCNQTASNLIFAQKQETRIEALQNRFHKTHPVEMDIQTYHNLTLDQLRECEEQLKLIDEKINTHHPVSQVLVELIEPLPPGISLHEALYQKENHLLQFSVIIPRGEKIEPISSDQLIVRWKKRPIIRNLVETITAVYSDRSIVHKQEVYLVRFRCILKEKV